MDDEKKLHQHLDHLFDNLETKKENGQFVTTGKPKKGFLDYLSDSFKDPSKD